MNKKKHGQFSKKTVDFVLLSDISSHGRVSGNFHHQKKGSSLFDQNAKTWLVETRSPTHHFQTYPASYHEEVNFVDCLQGSFVLVDECMVRLTGSDSPHST